MKKVDHSDARELSFEQATEAFKGYPSFAQIPDVLFAGICENIDENKVEINNAREKIARLIWEDQVEKRDLTEDEKTYLLEDLRQEVGEKLRQYRSDQPSALKLVGSAD